MNSHPFYNLVSSFSYSESGSSNRIKFILIHNLSIRIKGRDFGYGVFSDQKDKVRLMFNGDIIMITDHYGWDGASPKFKFNGRWMGSPDPDNTVMATCVHDALYQFLHLPCMKINRKQADDILYGIMKQNRSKLALLYYVAVRMLGGIFRKFGDANRPKATCFME